MYMHICMLQEKNWTFYSVSQNKMPPRGPTFFPQNSSEFLIDFLHTYYTYLSTLDYKFLFNCRRF